MPKILVLTRYDRQGASSRLRFLQYLPFLNENGLETTVAPLLPSDYLPLFYATGRAPWRALAEGYLRRLLTLLRANRYDALWIEKELLPFFPAWFEQALTGLPYVVDYDDATFHTYDLHPSPVVRRLLGNKIDRVMRHAALVVAGNGYLAERAQRAGATRVEVLPTVVDLARYPHRPAPSEEPFTVGWVGSPTTLRYLRNIEPALHRLHRERPFRLVVVGADPVGFRGLDVTARPWHEATEAAEIGGFDVGVMPLEDGPWERGKCGYKLIQYMACGVPVVASPVGVNPEIMRHSHDGFLAEGEGTWVEALEKLRQDRQARGEMGAAARQRVAQHFSLAVAAPRLLEMLQEAVGAARRASS